MELDPVEPVDSLARKVLADASAQRAYLAAKSLRHRVAMVQDRLADFMTVATPTAKA